ncbi:MAG: hypothetical protein JJT94_14330 [Bernardetiaceae bacterium]|nr:hypothetical protein [Bernardetiaceae bacterium]
MIIYYKFMSVAYFFTICLLLSLLTACREKSIEPMEEGHTTMGESFEMLIRYENMPLKKIDLTTLHDLAKTYANANEKEKALILYQKLAAAAAYQKSIWYESQAILGVSTLSTDRFNNISYLVQLKALSEKIENSTIKENKAQTDSLQSIILQHIAGAYYTEKDFENALKYFQKQKEFEISKKGKPSINVQSNVAVTLFELGEVQKAYDILAHIVQDTALNTENRNWGITYCNYLHIYLEVIKDSLSHTEKQAFIDDFYARYISQSSSRELFSSKDNYYIFKYDYYLLRSKVANDIIDKIAYLDSTLLAMDSLVILQPTFSINQEDERLGALEKKALLLLENNLEGAIEAFNDYKAQKNKIFEHQLLFSQKALKHNEMLREQEKNYLASLHRQSQIQYMITASVIILLLVSLFLYREWKLGVRKRKHIEAQLAVHLKTYQASIDEKQAIMQEKQKLSELYSNKVKEEEDLKLELERMEAKLVFQDALIERKKQTIEAIQENLKTQEGFPNLLHKVKREIKRESDVEMEIVKIMDSIEDLYPGIFIKLKEQYPFLNTRELNVCALSLIDLTNKEMANLLSLSLRGLETLKYRLKKKLELTSEQDLKEFLIENFK